jgi:protein ImuB
MRTWIGLFLPSLPLDVFQSRWHDAPVAVLERERVLMYNGAARAVGVRSGLRRGGVQALAPQALLHERDVAREQQALRGVALALLQYTPEVAFDGEAGLVLDVSASLRAFGGRLALCRRLCATLRALGHPVRLALAPTAMGAHLLARAPRQSGRRRRVLRLERLASTLDALPFSLLEESWPHADWLEGIGCQTLGELRRLPRAGLQRRSSKDLINALDRAYGQAPELHEWLQAPPEFAVSIELAWRTEQVDSILHVLEGMLLQMVGWLVARQLAVSRLQVGLQHERGRTAVAPTLLEIALAEPAWQEAHLLRLLREKLGRLELQAPVIGVRLQVLELQTLKPPSGQLFKQALGDPADVHRLLELLVARLGEDAVLTPALVADHRPEVCNRWQSAMADLSRAPEMPRLARPFWLLERPLPLMLKNHRPFYGSPLRLASAPERIESGWWDGNFVARDYFIAIGAEAACYWIYRERAGDEVRWFLHGLFA